MTVANAKVSVSTKKNVNVLAIGIVNEKRKKNLKIVYIT